ncbi:MAG: hypothetical protein QXM76_04505 [Zestosphaera sp.]
MSRARKIHRCLKIVEYTSLPLTLLLLIYVLSGYGTVSPVPGVIGFTYPTSVRIHTLPLLRYLTAAIAALHLYGGAVVLAHRRVRNAILVRVIEVVGLALALLTVALATMSEIYMILS